jgi:chromosome segregation ATPase
MALSQSEKNQITNLKISIERVRKEITTLSERKKSTSERYSNYIKNTKDSNQKRNYRMSKIREVDSLKQQIERKKQEITRFKEQIQRIKS